MSQLSMQRQRRIEALEAENARLLDAITQAGQTLAEQMQHNDECNAEIERLRQREQDAIQWLAALVAKSGGKVIVSQIDLLAFGKRKISRFTNAMGDTEFVVEASP